MFLANTSKKCIERIVKSLVPTFVVMDMKRENKKNFQSPDDDVAIDYD